MLCTVSAPLHLDLGQCLRLPKTLRIAGPKFEPSPEVLSDCDNS